ncbi:GIY-YIG nuclease family protein [Pseudoxanthomonas wuyuanensis]
MSGRRIVPLDGVGTGADGRAFLYVFPCAYEDFAKFGISTNPLARLHAFSSRYYEFFDLQRGWLVEAESVREARQWETRWKRQLRDHAAPAPLLVPARAAGHTEWLRGAQPALEAARAQFAAQGFVVHSPLAAWVRQRLAGRIDLLDMGEQAAIARFGPIDAWQQQPLGTPLAALRDALDAYAELEIALDGAISPALRAWHARCGMSARLMQSACTRR